MVWWSLGRDAAGARANRQALVLATGRGEHPIAAARFPGLLYGVMRIKQKKELTCGDLITAAYQIRGAGQAEKMVRLASNARLVVFREPPHCLTFFAKGRSV